MLSAYVQRFREDEELELEMRFCSKQSTTVDLLTFQELLKMMMQSTKHGIFEGSEKPSCFIDYFYENNVRQRCKSGGKTEVIQKTPQYKTIGTCPQRESYQFVFTLKREHVLTNEEIEKLLRGVKPLYVRCHFCWTFVYKNQFAYIFKKVRSGENKEIACSATQPDGYEIEMELLRDEGLLASIEDDELISSMFVEKSLDLAGRYKANTLSTEKLTMSLECVKEEQTEQKNPGQNIINIQSQMKRKKKNSCKQETEQPETTNNTRKNKKTKQARCQKKLLYERRGTEYECLTKGYGKGAAHIQDYSSSSMKRNKKSKQPLNDNQEPKDKDGYLRTVDELRSTVGITSSANFRTRDEMRSDLDEAFEEEEEQERKEERKEEEEEKKHEDGNEDQQITRAQREQIIQNPLDLLRETFEYPPDQSFIVDDTKVLFDTRSQQLSVEVACYVYERVSAIIFSNSAFYGIVQPQNFTKRKIEMLEESFSLHIVRETVFHQTQWVHMAEIMLSEGTLFFLLKGLTIDLAPITGVYVLCEVNFRTQKIIFYYSSSSLPLLHLSWYKRIMIQQFVMPFDNKWKFVTIPFRGRGGGDDNTDISILLMICYQRQNNQLAYIDYLHTLQNRHARLAVWLLFAYNVIFAREL